MFSILHSAADYQVRLSMFYLYLLNALVILDAVFEGSFPNFSLMYQEWVLWFITHDHEKAGEKKTVLTGGWQI